MGYQSAIESSAVLQSPIHPVPRLQAPFNESMAESAVDKSETDVFPDVVSRRNHLLDAPVYTRAVSGRWKQRRGEKYHPLWKLIAQISFGIHLLAGGLARSEDEVMQILQAHVDEIDGFLERTTEDFELAQQDIQERLRCLKLPLSHPATFDRMLEDRNFRLSIVNGNEKIEHIVERTSQAMKDSLKDVQKGFDSTTCLDGYMKELAQTWMRQTVEHEAVFVAMQGNVEGWRKAFMSLHVQGSHLGGSLKKLTDIVNEMQKRAGEISRRLLHQAKGYSPTMDPRIQQHRSPPTGHSTLTSRFAPNKDLPGMPDRPSIHTAGSHNSVETDLSTRVASPDPRPATSLSSRVSTPQYDLLPSRNSNASPAMSQQSEKDRVQSVTPSVLGSRASLQSATNTIKSRSTDDEEPMERYFPPVELPASVPDNAISKVPISKQTRLSVVVKPAPTASREKRSTKTPASALMGLLKSNHMLSKSSASSTKSSSTSPADESRIQTETKSSEATKPNDATNEKSPELTNPALGSIPDEVMITARSATPVDSTASSYTKNNKRKPKKGVKHWFDALEDDMSEDDKIITRENSSSQINTTSIEIAEKPKSERNSIPGTPVWAATKFASQEHRRQDLKFGAFGSHPSQLPPGSPPLAKINMPNPLGVIQARPTSTEPLKTAQIEAQGPEVIASPIGKSSTNPRPTSGNPAWKRKSVIAPEVLSVQKAAVRPARSMQFIAEMEGSVPSGSVTYKMPSAIAVELEAPQQYFRLPPRPSTACDLPLAAKTTPSEISTQVPELRKEEVENTSKVRSVPPSEVSQLCDPGSNTSESVPIPELENPVIDQHADEQAVEDGGVKDQVEEKIVETQLLLPARAYIPTPQIPLPPSPCETEEPPPTIEKEVPQGPAKDNEPIFLLPAVAYKAPSANEAPPLEVSTDNTILVTERPASLKTTQVTAASPPILKEICTTVSTQAPTSAETSVPDPSPTSTTIITATFSEFVARGPPPQNLGHARSRSSHGSHNGWKAFFTGQPSPASSSLTIRSMRRESLDDMHLADQQSPDVLLPSPIGSAMLSSPTSMSVRDSRLFSPAFDREKEAARDVFGEQDKSDTIRLGLGIQAIAVHQE